MNFKMSVSMILILACNVYAKQPFCSPDPAGADWDGVHRDCINIYPAGNEAADAAFRRREERLRQVGHDAKSAYNHITLAGEILKDDIVKTHRAPYCIGPTAPSRRNCQIIENMSLTYNDALTRERVVSFQNRMEYFFIALGITMNGLDALRREFGVSLADVGGMDSALQVVHREYQAVKVFADRLSTMGHSELSKLVIGEPEEPVTLPCSDFPTGKVVMIPRKGPSAWSVLMLPQTRYLREAVESLSWGNLEKPSTSGASVPEPSRTPPSGALWPHADMFDDPCHVMTPGCLWRY